ncbi:MAG: ATP-binding cassette domain-containing protein [Thermoplasmatales archaeon]|nr:ATP-binding cassette domain-containing protein [Thermoplasmatales archaeon]
MDSALRMRGVSVVRGGIRILDGIDLDVAKGEGLAIIGPNGSGKTTLVNLFRGEILPYMDEERPPEMAIFGRDRWNLFDVRSLMGVVSMDLQDSIPGTTPLSEVILSGFFGSLGVYRIHTVTDDMLEGVAQAAGTMGLTELLDAPFGRLSLGEKRRGLIARALAPGPTTLVLDEPMTGLDVVMRARFREMFGIMMANGMGIVLITHDLADIPPGMERIVLLKEGKVFIDGPKEKLLTSEILSDVYGEPIAVRESGGVYSMDLAGGVNV